MTFTISTEDEREAKRLTKSTDMACALFEIVHNLKRKAEGSRQDIPSSDFYSGIDAAFDLIQNELNDRGVNIDDLID